MRQTPENWLQRSATAVLAVVPVAATAAHRSEAASQTLTVVRMDSGAMAPGGKGTGGGVGANRHLGMDPVGGGGGGGREREGALEWDQ